MLKLGITVIILIGLRVIEAICLLKSIPYFFIQPKRCPPVDNNILLLSASSLAEKIRKKKITSEAVIKAYISRIKAVDPILNAVVEDRFDAALREAQKVDDFISKTELSIDELAEKYPLLGLPLTVKESIAVKGLSHGAGRVFPLGKKAQEDADTVKLCKEAGAIPVVVSNTPELCINFESYNKVTGTTNNPYDSRRTPGGSSGGEGALLGSAASVIGLGSDLFGSLRLPANFCCVWTHKPSPSTVSIEGHYPDCKQKEPWREIFNIGPMTRYFEDLPLLFNVLLEKNYRSLLRLNQPVDIKDIKIYYMENDGGSLLTHSIHQDIINAMHTLTTHLETQHKCKVKKIHFKKFKSSPELSFTRLHCIDDVDNLFDNNGKGSFIELFRFFTGRSNSVFPSILYGITKKIYKSLPSSILHSCKIKLSQMKEELCEILNDDGILLYPCHATPPNIHGQVFGKVFDYSYTGIFNCLGLPATNCPLGLNSEGLPIGIQVIAAPNNDRLTLAVGQEIAKVFGGWIPPPFSVA